MINGGNDEDYESASQGISKEVMTTAGTININILTTTCYRTIKRDRSRCSKNVSKRLCEN